MAAWDSHFIDVGGIRTHYLEAGHGPTLVLLHSGEFGDCAELSWEHNIGAFAEHFRVITPASPPRRHLPRRRIFWPPSTTWVWCAARPLAFW